MGLKTLPDDGLSENEKEKYTMLELGEDRYTVGLLKTLRNPVLEIKQVFNCEQWLAEAVANEAMKLSDYADIRKLYKDMATNYVVVPMEEAEEWDGYVIHEYSSASVAVFWEV